MESPRLIASLTRLVRDVGIAEEIAQDAFVLALEQWPEQGVPDKPGAWLTATAKHKAIDRIRRERSRQSKYTEIAVDPSAQPPSAMPAPDAVDGVEDDLLALVFVACHPVLPRESRVALTFA